MGSMSSAAVQVEGIERRFGERIALADVRFEVGRGEMFGLLGPNGGGKTTLFRILSTLIAPTSGDARIGGASVVSAAHEARRQLGVVFPRPSSDGMLTVEGDLTTHASLYRLGGAAAQRRISEAVDRLGIADRRRDRVDTLSGGLQRRVELAKALLHQPPILLLDEPSSGLDPGARREFFHHLEDLRRTTGVTVVLTTHFMEEAERCDRIAILHRGRIVRIGAPHDLKAEVGGDVVVLQGAKLGALRDDIRARFGCEAQLVDGTLRIERPRGHEFVRDVVEAFPGDIGHITFGKPTLEDVFVHATGDRFWDASEAGE